MALFRRKADPADQGPADSRSKRGGVRKTTQDIKIDLSELEERADGGGAPAAPEAASGPAGATQRLPAPTRRHAAVSRRTTRMSGRGTPIGDLLVQAGAVNQNQVNQALKVQQKQGGLLGQILVAMGACRPEDIAEALDKQFRFTQVDLSRFRPKIDALLLLTPEKCRELKAIPFERLDQLLCVAMVNVLNRTAKTQLETLTKLKVKGFTSVWSQIQPAIRKYYVTRIEEGAHKVEEERAKGLPAIEVAEKVAEEIRQAVAESRAAGGKPAARAEAAEPTVEAAGPAPAPAAPSPDVQAAQRTALRSTSRDAQVSPDVAAEKYIRDAQALRSQGKLDEALRRLKAGAAAATGSKKLAALLKQVTGEVEARAKEEQDRAARLAGLLAKGRQDYEAGDFEAAIQKFQEATGLEPENRVLARELAKAQKELVRKRAEEVARRKAEEDAKALEEKRKAEEAERLSREVEQLMGLVKEAREADNLEEIQSRLKDVLSIQPGHAEAISELGKVEAALAERERKRAEELAAELAKPKVAEEQDKLEERKAKEEKKRKKAHIRSVLREAAQDREAGRFEIALRKLRSIVEEAPASDQVGHAIDLVEADLAAKRAEEEERRRTEEEERRKAAEDIQRRAAAAAEVQSERQRMGAAATAGEKRVEAGVISEDSLAAIEVTPKGWHARIAEALATDGGEAASTEEALRRLPVAQRYARSREELRAMADAVRAAEAALEEVEEVQVGGQGEPAELDSEIEAIMEAIPEEELADEELAEVAEVIAIPETRAEAEAISEEEFTRLEPELEADPVLEWLVTYAGFGRAAAVPVEE